MGETNSFPQGNKSETTVLTHTEPFAKAEKSAKQTNKS